jgi:hypothetical protein
MIVSLIEAMPEGNLGNHMFSSFGREKQHVTLIIIGLIKTYSS